MADQTADATPDQSAAETAGPSVLSALRRGSAFPEPAITLGAATLDGVVHADAPVRLPLSMLNRHGLVAGATGTGKTVTVQTMAEQLSDAGVPVVLADVKGDLSGLVTVGTADEELRERTAETGMDWQPSAYPVEFLALGGNGTGIPVRATVDAFGPQLLARIMDLNDTEGSCLRLMFRWADRRDLILEDLEDLRAVVLHLTSDEGQQELKGLGGVATSTAHAILREITTLQAEGLDRFFGVPEFETAELLRQAPDGRGVISCLELSTLRHRPVLFSTFMMWLLADLFAELPEVGDVDRPRLVFFLDEAHLVFQDVSRTFREAIKSTVRLIRPKGVGIFFVTQTPQDVPADVLGQLSHRVQHALCAVTPDDATALRRTVSTFPHAHEGLEEVLTSPGTGEAVVTVVGPEGSPTPLALTRMWSPRSTIGPADPAVMEQLTSSSALRAAYGQDRERGTAAEHPAGTDPPPGQHDDGARPGAPAPAGTVPTGGSVATHLPGAGQSQGDIDAEVRRIETQILGHRLSSAGAPAPKNPTGDLSRDVATAAPSAFGRQTARSIFGTKRRGRRRGGLFW